MEPPDFFDCSCSAGMRGILNPGSFYTFGDLTQKVNDYGIKKALVYHSMAREYHPVTGNRMLMDEVGNHPCLYPVWVVMHHHTGEFPGPEKLIGQMKENNVRAVRMFPGVSDQNYCIAEWNCGELFAVLEKHEVPLMIGLEQLTWNELYELCSNHPGLRIILTEVNYRINRNLYTLLKKFEYLYIETMGYKVHHGIEEICEKLGAQRLVFGSGMPLYPGGAAVSMINYARISEKEKRMIAHENLENLLGGVRL